MNNTCLNTESSRAKTIVFDSRNTRVRHQMTMPTVYRFSQSTNSVRLVQNYEQYKHAHYDIFVSANFNPFADRVNLPTVDKNAGALQRSKKASPPSWLLQRMEALRRLPPPTLQEVETSFRAAEEARRKYVPNPSNYINGR